MRPALSESDHYPQFLEFNYTELYDSGTAGLLLSIVNARQLPPGQTWPSSVNGLRLCRGLHPRHPADQNVRPSYGIVARLRGPTTE